MVGDGAPSPTRADHILGMGWAVCEKLRTLGQSNLPVLPQGLQVTPTWMLKTLLPSMSGFGVSDLPAELMLSSI